MRYDTDTLTASTSCAAMSAGDAECHRTYGAFNAYNAAGKRDIPEKTRQPTKMSTTLPVCLSPNDPAGNRTRLASCSLLARLVCSSVSNCRQVSSRQHILASTLDRRHSAISAVTSLSRTLVARLRALSELGADQTTGWKQKYVCVKRHISMPRRSAHEEYHHPDPLEQGRMIGLPEAR
ncbi:hypothetical protein PR048_000497 [Dryococelus australis]|uniref:Uncharacterized protein n=1 Tax=Dryococelus australis TaxID=614101 RepID=A0ABQ9IES5_9NEOP|nr:hypothetical protein PR048_000497 [Dryococelus australis]